MEVRSGAHDVELHASAVEGFSVRCEAEDEAHERTVDGGVLHLFGLLADTAYDCSLELDGRVSELELRTEPELAELEGVDLEMSEPAAGAEGYLLTNLFRSTGRYTSESQVVVVLDLQGRVRWAHPVPEADHALVAEFLPAEQAFLIGGGLFVPLQPQLVELSGQLRQTVGGLASHELRWLGDGVLFLATDLAGFCAEDWNLQEELRWSLCDEDHPALPADEANTLGLAEEAGLVLVAVPSAGLIAAIDRGSGEVPWTLGAEGSIRPTPEDGFDWVHDLQVIPCEEAPLCLLYYDNGQERGYSRASLLAVDPEADSAWLLRSWTEEGWYEPHLGSVVQVEDSEDWLIARGHSEAHVPQSTGTTLLRLGTRDEVQWRMEIGPEDVSLYRARFIDGCDLFDRVGSCVP